MTGRTIRVCPPRDFDFSGLAASQEEIVTVGERIDVSQYDELDLIVRLHEGTLPTPGVLTVRVVSDGFTPDDPSVDFFGAPVGDVTFDDEPTAPTLRVTSISSGLGAMIAVQVVGTQAASPVTISARVSIDVALKTR